MSEQGQSPDYFVAIHQAHSGGTDSFVLGMGPYADQSGYQSGWKPPTLVEIGDIERLSSNDQGEPETSRCMIRFRDTDGFWLQREDDDEKQSLAGSEAVVQMVSRLARFGESEPTTLFRGRIRSYGPKRGLDQFAVIEDILGSQFGPFALNRPVQKNTIGVDFPGSNPKIQYTQTVPAWWGEHSDKGVTANGAPFEVGRVPGYYVGDYVVNTTSVVPVSHVSSGTQTLPPPPAPTYDKFGAGGTHTWTYAFAARTATGRTTLGASTTITDLPGGGNFSPTNGVTLFVAEYPSELQQHVEGLDLYVKEGGASSSAPWKFMDAAGQAFDGGYDDNGDDSHNKPWNPPASTNTATITTTFTTIENVTVENAQRMRMFLFSAGYVKITQLFAHPVGEDAVSDRIETSLTGPDFITPESASWPFANPWYEINGHRYTIVLGIGARADLVVEGRGSIAANVCGFTEDNTASTPMVSGAFYQLFRALNDFVLANGGTGYLGGNWPATVAWPGSPTIPVLNYDSFEECQEYSRRKMSNDVGWLGNLFVDSAITLREFLRNFCTTFDCYFYSNQFGQICIGVVNELMSVAGAPPLRDRIEIKEVDETIIHDEQVENRIRFRFGWHAGLRRYLPPVEIVEDTISQGRHQGGVREPKEPIDCIYTNDPATARSTMGHRLMRLNYAPRYTPFVVHYAPGANLDIGQPVLVTSYAINGTARPYLIRGHRTTVGTARRDGHVTLRCLDMSRFANMWNPIVQAHDSATPTVFAHLSNSAVVR